MSTKVDSKEESEIKLKEMKKKKNGQKIHACFYLLLIL